MHSMQLALVSQAPGALSLIRIGPPEPVRPRGRQNRGDQSHATRINELWAALEKTYADEMAESGGEPDDA